MKCAKWPIIIGYMPVEEPSDLQIVFLINFQCQTMLLAGEDSRKQISINEWSPDSIVCLFERSNAKICATLGYITLHHLGGLNDFSASLRLKWIRLFWSLAACNYSGGSTRAFRQAVSIQRT